MRIIFSTKKNLKEKTICHIDKRHHRGTTQRATKKKRQDSGDGTIRVFGIEEVETAGSTKDIQSTNLSVFTFYASLKMECQDNNKNIV